MPWTIAPLQPSDADVLGREHNRIWRVAYADLLPAHVLAARDDEAAVRGWRARAEHHVAHGSSPEGGVTYVAHDETGRPIGFVTVGRPRDEDAPTPTELWALNVVPEHWGTGVAHDLVQQSLPDGPAYLWVLEGNERAIAFYRRHGFALDGVTKQFPGRGATELRMTRPS